MKSNGCAPRNAPADERLRRSSTLRTRSVKRKSARSLVRWSICGASTASCSKLLPERIHGLGNDEGRGHAEIVRHDEVLGDVLEHGRASRIDPVLVEEALIGAPLGLRHEIGGGDVEHILEMIEDADLPRDVLRMLARAVGEDELAARQLLDRLAKACVQLDIGMVDIVGEIEKIVRVDIVFVDQGPQGRAVLDGRNISGAPAPTARRSRKNWRCRA